MEEAAQIRNSRCQVTKLDDLERRMDGWKKPHAPLLFREKDLYS